MRDSSPDSSNGLKGKLIREIKSHVCDLLSSFLFLFNRPLIVLKFVYLEHCLELVRDENRIR